MDALIIGVSIIIGCFVLGSSIHLLTTAVNNFLSRISINDEDDDEPWK